MKRDAARRLVVLKIGGSVAEGNGSARVLDQVAAAWRAGAKILLVHGGGRELSRWLERLSIGSRFIEGQRVTGPDALQVALMVLGGLINRRTVEELARRGCPAVGLTGADGGGSLAAPLANRALGAVGRIVSVDAAFYERLIAARRLPVVASLGYGPEHGWLNVNADLMAGALAAALRARCLLLLTDVPGVRDRTGATLRTLTLAGMRRLVADGVARDGMLPKLEAGRLALEAGVPEVRIVAPGDADLARALDAADTARGARGAAERARPARRRAAGSGTRILIGARIPRGATP